MCGTKVHVTNTIFFYVKNRTCEVFFSYFGYFKRTKKPPYSAREKVVDKTIKYFVVMIRGKNIIYNTLLLIFSWFPRPRKTINVYFNVMLLLFIVNGGQ